MADYGQFLPHTTHWSSVACLFRGLMPSNMHCTLQTGGAELPSFYTFGVLLLSTLDPLALMAAFKAHQDYTNPDATKLLSKNPADRLSTQIQAYYSDLSPLLVTGFYTRYTTEAHPFDNTVVAVASANGVAWTQADTAKLMGGVEYAVVNGGTAHNLYVPTVTLPFDGKCHRSGLAKSFLVTGHAVAPDGSKMLDAECDAAYANVFAVDLAGTVSGIDGNGDMKVSDANLVAGRTYTFQDMAIAPNCSMLMVE